jgi:hypothetical protein
VQRIDRVDLIVFADDHDDAFAHCDKFGMWDREFSAVGKMNDERLETAGDQILDPLNIHFRNSYAGNLWSSSRSNFPLIGKPRPLAGNRIPYQSHVPGMVGGARTGWAYSIGYIKALLAAVSAEKS